MQASFLPLGHSNIFQKVGDPPCSFTCVMERQTCPEIGWYQSFGLAVYCTRPGSQVLLTALFDISLDRAFVERLAEDCTRFQLDPVHLMDVAEDALA